MILIADPTIGISLPPPEVEVVDMADDRIGCDDDEFGGCEETF